MCVARRMWAFLVVLASLLGLSGCIGSGGGGGGAAGSILATVSGTASNGAAMSGTVHLKDATGKVTSAAIVSAGQFTITVDGFTAPYLLKAVSTDGNLIRYSLAAANGTTNINPLTHLAVAGAAGTADLDGYYQSTFTGNSTAASNGFKTYTKTIVSQLAQLFSSFSVTDTDFASGKIEIGKGIDAVFDYVKLSTIPQSNMLALYSTANLNKAFLEMNLSGNQMAVNVDTTKFPTKSQRPAFTMTQTVSDVAQSTTIAFSGLALMTGNLAAQSFFPPGKVADYTGFQYLRDNDSDNMGHNTSFLTRVANNVIYILDDVQLAQLSTLATLQQTDFDLYAYKRFPLMQAFRRLIDGNLPSGATGLNLASIKKASRELYLIDGQISFDRAVLYAKVINSLSSTQKAYLDAMKGKGWSSWPDVTDAQIDTKMKTLPQGAKVAVMTYASDIYSWYAGSVEADTYFCPERHGTYYGGFYIKDAPAVGHEGYSIDEQMTATAGSALLDTAKGYVTKDQATLMNSLVATQKANLDSIVSTRTQIATLLRSLLTTSTSADSVKTQVLSLSGTYGELDGENNYYYATVFNQVYASLSAEQKTKLASLRKSMLSGKYADGTAFDFTVASKPFLYSATVMDTQLAPYVADTATSPLFFAP